MRGRGGPRSPRACPAGRLSRAAHSTGSPDFAAQPAAGIANAGASARGDDDGLARRARRAGGEAVDAAGQRGEVRALDVRVPCRPSGAGRRSHAETCAPPACGAPGGRAPRAPRRSPRQLVALGEEDRRADRRRHQLGGGDRRAPVVAVDERDGRRPRVARARRKTARATPAASATGSAPPTRVVFFVAKAGKPSAPAAPDSPPSWPSAGVPPSPPRTAAAAAPAAAGDQQRDGEQRRRQAWRGKRHAP